MNPRRSVAWNRLRTNMGGRRHECSVDGNCKKRTRPARGGGSEKQQSPHYGVSTFGRELPQRRDAVVFLIRPLGNESSRNQGDGTKHRALMAAMGQAAGQP